MGPDQPVIRRRAGDDEPMTIDGGSRSGCKRKRVDDDARVEEHGDDDGEEHGGDDVEEHDGALMKTLSFPSNVVNHESGTSHPPEGQPSRRKSNSPLLNNNTELFEEFVCMLKDGEGAYDPNVDGKVDDTSLEEFRRQF